MDGVEYDCLECEKDGNPAFRIPGGLSMLRKHVAIFHIGTSGSGKDFFSNHCGDCNDAFYDQDHFTKHLRTSTTCKASSLKVVPVSKTLEHAFNHLVSQMGREIKSSANRPASTASNLSLNAQAIKSEAMEVDAPVPAATQVTRAAPAVIDIDSDDDDEVDRKDPKQISLMSEAMGDSIATSEPNESMDEQVAEPPAKKSALKPKGRPGRKPGALKKTSAVATPAKATPAAVTPAKATRSQVKKEPASAEKEVAPAKKAVPPPAKKAATPAKKTVKEEVVESPDVGGRRTRSRINYAEPGSDEDEEEEEDNSDDEDDYQPSGDEDEGGEAGGEEDDEDGSAQEAPVQSPKKTQLNRCQLCVELQNGRAPIYSRQEKEAHALIHLKFSPRFSELTDERAKEAPEFTKVMRMCFEEGFYDELKRQDGDENMDTAEPEASTSAA